MGNYYSRSQWTGHMPGWSSMGRVRNVFIHHTADGGAPGFDASYLRNIERYEMNKGGYIALAYHRIIFPNGDRAESRPWGVKGGATMNNNNDSVAICFAGNYENQTPTEAALQAAAFEIDWARDHGFIENNMNVRGHRDVFPTACPGRNLYGALPNLIGKIQRLGGSPAPFPSPPPPSVDWAAIRKALAKKYAPEVRRGPTLRPGSHGPEVVQWQTCVNLISDKTAIAVDGKFGKNTERQTRVFQAFWNLHHKDGVVYTETREAMSKNLELVAR